MPQVVGRARRAVRIPGGAGLALLGALVASGPGLACAEEPEPDAVRFTTRPVVLPRGALTTSVELGARWLDASYAVLAQRIELSVLDALSVRVVPATALISEPGGFGVFELGTTVRLASGALEPTLSADLGLTGGGSFTVAPAAGLAAHVSETFRVDLALHPTFVAKDRVAVHLDRLSASLLSRGLLAVDFWFALRRELAVSLWTCFGADNLYAMEGTGFAGLGMSWLGTVPWRGRPLLDLRLDAGHPTFHRFVTPTPQLTRFQLLGSLSVHGDVF